MSAVITALTALGIIAIIFGVVLGFAAVKFRVKSDPIVDQINALLPQTQCGQCGYPGCRPYAEAIANGDDINKCPPGGEETVKRLAELLGVEAKPLSDAHADKDLTRKVAFIHEEDCIGCTKCIQACPVDAIMGAPRQMHTIIENECTGCDLCVDPCPTNCIEMIPVKDTPQNWQWELNNNIPIKQV